MTKTTISLGCGDTITIKKDTAKNNNPYVNIWISSIDQTSGKRSFSFARVWNVEALKKALN